MVLISLQDRVTLLRVVTATIPTVQSKSLRDMLLLMVALLHDITTAAEEQSASSEEIRCAIEDINRIVGETTNGMAQSFAAVQELSRMAQELNSVMLQLDRDAL